MKAIVDCNSFYCSCERLFQPRLEGKPVVVLSNNDGCIISRTDEAKALGIGMAGPYFKEKERIEAHDVAVFSSNYNLYGNLSWRVMETLRQLAGPANVEVYSVDEAFVDLETFEASDLHALALEIRHTVEKWTGIRVSVGIAPTKTLAKLANHLAKRDKERSQCIWVLDSPESRVRALKATRLQNVWGIGGRSAEKLEALGLTTAWDLCQLSEEWMRRHLGGVVGMRLHRELNGIPSLFLNEELTTKKMIATTRMFGSPVTELDSIREAVATYTSRAAEKLRRQHSAASMISVFVVPREEKGQPYRRGGSLQAQRHLPVPTVLTQELIKPAMGLVETLFEKGRSYKKAGVILSGLVPDSSIQSSLFEAPEKNLGRFLMEMMDNINFSMRGDVVKFAASGLRRNWKMRQDHHSPRYTTRWDELPGIG